jgi:solute carrier family 24 (sodium/potassium/calcium exchanger), member 6
MCVEDNELLMPMLYALLSGLIALGLLLTFSSPSKPPGWHRALCAVGFLVAIGWISTIADEVVGVLRAVGAILGVSEAILGVTVFAVVTHPSYIASDIRGIPYRILSRT